MGTPSMAVMRAETAKATSGAALTPGCACDQAGQRLALRAGNIQQEDVGHPGRGAAADLAHQRLCTRNTVSVNITPTPNATTADCAWLPGR